MKILNRDEPWPELEALDLDGVPVKSPKHPRMLVMEARVRIQSRTGFDGFKIICHPKHKPVFFNLPDFHGCYTIRHDEDVEKFCGMDVIWSTHHGLEVVCDCDEL